MIRGVMTILSLGVALSATSAAAQSWSGIYRKADGGMVGIGEFHEFGPSQILVDYETGEVGPLLALPDGRTGIGRAIGDRASPPARILERNAGRIFRSSAKPTAMTLTVCTIECPLWRPRLSSASRNEASVSLVRHTR